MSDDLTEVQQAKLDDDATNRQPIGADEILLVGDVRFGIPVLKRYYHGENRDDSVRSALEYLPCQVCARYMAWTRTGVEESFKTVMEVHRLRELVLQAESAVVQV